MRSSRPLSTISFSRLAAGLLVVIGSLIGCSDADDGTVSDDGVDDGMMEPDPDPRPAPDLDVERYELAGEFDWARNRLVATVRITVATPARPTAIVLDSAVTEVKAVRLAGGDDLPFSVDRAEGRVTIDMAPAAELAVGTVLALEIDYEAEAGPSLVTVPTRDGDPVTARIVYTASEPLGVPSWMPCHNTPVDRAIFSIDMRLDGGETLIANGELVADQGGDASARRMKYETSYSLPMYLMAFAISDFEVERTTRGDLPIAVWHRRGLVGDYETMLAEMARLVDLFEERLGLRYPFEKYDIVLVPNFAAFGLEHASIIFQFEAFGAQPALAFDLVLMAHELSHQWIGDLVTIESWDDLWIKEGMATLLQAEGTRAYTDQANTGTLNVDFAGIVDGQAIRDVGLPPASKYTSGPYGRAAWLLSQIRGLVGEETFWRTIRELLQEHSFGAIGTDEFVAAFAPALGPDATARTRRAIDAVAIPRLEATPTRDGGALMTWTDPDGALVAPLDLAWVAPDGSVREQTVELDGPTLVAPQTDEEFLVIDPSDIHPNLAVFMSGEGDYSNYLSELAPLRVPPRSAQNSLFLDGPGGVHQFAALSEVGLPRVAPAQFSAFLAALDGEPAKAVAVGAACAAAEAPGVDPEVRAAWSDVLSDVLSGPPYTFGLPLTGGYAACSDLVGAADLFAADWSQLQTGLSAGGVSDPRLLFLSFFSLPRPMALSTWRSVAQEANSLRARFIATSHLVSYLPQLTPADIPDWRAFFIDLVSATKASEVLGTAIPALVATGAPTAAENAGALASLSPVLRTPVASLVHFQAVCAAFRLTRDDDAAWSEFKANLDRAVIAPAIAALLDDPSSCP